MELGYLRRLHFGIAGRIDFGECVRPVDQFPEEREALEQMANALDHLARTSILSVKARETLANAAFVLMRSGY